MPITEITAKTILRKYKTMDSWFLSRYGMNLYRGCAHNCSYCDGRSEGYYVPGKFGCDVQVKVNAVEILSRELDPKRKRIPLRPSFMLVGGGVGDAYQPAEEKLRLTRGVLSLLCERNWPVHVLTKSTLVLRDLDLLSKINTETRSIVSSSFSTVDDKIASQFEPGVPPPSQRLKMLSQFKRAGIACGMYLLPVIPFVTDSPGHIDAAFKAAKEIDLDFVVCGGMTLKEGAQADHFLQALRDHYPEYLHEYSIIYTGDKWGNADPRYYASLSELFIQINKRYGIPFRMPPHLYRDIPDRNDLVSVMLSQIDQLLKMKGNSSPYGYAAYSVSQLKEPIDKIRGEISKIKGVGPRVRSTILEILDTGNSNILKSLLVGR